MKIVADENIPFVETLFSPLGQVVLKAGRELCAADVADADILLVRSVTQVNSALLDGSSVRFVGTCTIGVDHLDTSYLDQRGVTYTSAPGCNANAVVQYVVSVLAHLDALDFNKSVVIVGGGNVGSRVYRTLTEIGFHCRCVDPFLTPSSGMKLADFAAVYEADILCVHTPLTTDGEFPTTRMFTAEELGRLKADAIVINAGRGGVMDNEAVEARIDQQCSQRFVLDVWEGEPDIRQSLVNKVTLGSPHIAGYSYEGRVKGSLMVFEALCGFLGLSQEKMLEIQQDVHEEVYGDRSSLSYTNLREVILAAYDVSRDDKALRKAREALPEVFDQLRKHYPIRREFSHYRCQVPLGDDAALLASLGFETHV